MTREEAIKQYKYVVNAVFKAEDAIKIKWIGRLAEIKFLEKDDPRRDQIADEYLEALATEIVSKMSDEELSKL